MRWILAESASGVRDPECEQADTHVRRSGMCPQHPAAGVRGLQVGDQANRLSDSANKPKDRGVPYRAIRVRKARPVSSRHGVGPFAFSEGLPPIQSPRFNVCPPYPQAATPLESMT